MLLPCPRRLTFATALALLGGALVAGVAPAAEPQPPFQAKVKTEASFHTNDQPLQALFDAALAQAKGNIVPFTPAMGVLVEGGGYPNAWIETQPMGGQMFARHNAQVALNNQVIFMRGQRQDGRLPGMVIAGDKVRQRGWDENPREGYVWYPEHHLASSFEMLQGYCFPQPAWRMYHWAKQDKAYLRQLYQTLKAHDAYLWRTRDSNGDGILESWCVWDTGEDGSSRLRERGAPSRWPFEKPPGAEGVPKRSNPEAVRRYWFGRGEGAVRVPLASMDMMAYSYAGRAALAKIARELDNGQAAHWRAQAEEVRQRLIDELWSADRHACFDRDRNGQRLDELIHNNLRCMWYGIFTQQMADAFIKHHLMDPEAFWTPVPLVSIAVNEPLFANECPNDWSGQPQGLTYQRAIAALENYGHYAEVTLLGRKLLPVLTRNDNKFTQQLDPFTGEPCGHGGYGPMILAALEYINRMHGIYLDFDRQQVWWSGLAKAGQDFTYRQQWGQKKLMLQCEDGQLRATINGEEAFTASAGARIVTDFDGQVIKLVGIDPQPRQVKVQTGAGAWDLTVAPNQAYRLDSPDPAAVRTAPFNAPPANPLQDRR
jgi:hypothetical protein